MHCLFWIIDHVSAHTGRLDRAPFKRLAKIKRQINLALILNTEDAITLLVGTDWNT